MSADPPAGTPPPTGQPSPGQPAAPPEPPSPATAGAIPAGRSTPAAGPVAPPGAAGPRAFADVAPVRLPDWMRPPEAEHRPAGMDRVRFAWARHNGALVVGLGIALALAMLAGGGWLVLRTADGYRAATSAPTQSPTPLPSSEVGMPRDLFAGTPAAAFPSGEDAVVLPAATAQGPFTAAQVRAALESVRAALVESRLETNMLVGDVEPFLARLAPDARKQLRPHFEDSSFLRYATRMESRSGWKPDIRAQGRISYRATRVEGVRLLEVTTEFVWVYSFDVARKAPPGAGLVAIRDRVVWQVPHPGDMPASGRGLWLASARAVAWNTDCGWLRDGWVQVATWMPDLHGERLPGGDPGDIFDLDAPAPTTTRC
ncbi:hypothetical protein [Micromonospora echinaurantiaca]|uniref:hypothetical protein n=1 Tax=Micromonospora echinaurantiaca TaxID=47857 RepID=UPI00341A16FE